MRHNHERLEALRRLALLDTAAEVVYDDLTRTLAQAFDVPISLVNLLDADRDWFKSSIGVSQAESPVDTSFCEIFFHCDDDLLVIPDTLADPRFADHPMVIGAPCIRFYASARLRFDGHTVGTLCIYDTRVKEVSAAQIETLGALRLAAMEVLAKRARAA
ncbi:MAG: GAF domain-containing protein [Pseudomonadota bacterium]|uniref:GAF domain-containing protein n=1 Tax=Polaromonas sp. TaxID=1869339 RepID=UPI0017CEEA80|nr:GAF domain-containing protein [Polaromonas sp.]MBA3593810.1 GAF domain-containing protein [Polaromonas sp.]MDQ3272250.1 GAF domain-containing protein [Pseudomonadota bacterium]